MNWKLIGALSLFGLAMGVGTATVISSNVEPFLWLAIFVFCAYAIARYAPDRRFLHGLVLGIANSVWVTGAHVMLFDRYVVDHGAEAAAMAHAPLAPRAMMLLVGPVIGVVSGLVIGLFAWVAGKFVRPASATT